MDNGLDEDICKVQCQQPINIWDIRNQKEKYEKPKRKWAKDINRHFVEGENWMVNKHVEKMFNSPTKWEMQTKAVVYNFQPIWIAKIRKLVLIGDEDVRNWHILLDNNLTAPE